MTNEKNDYRIVFSWETVDIIKNPAADLYMAISVLASMGMIAWGIYTRSFMVVATFVILAAVIILTLNEEPKKMRVKISENGIDINGAHYGFSDFKSFDVSYSQDVPALNLNPKKPYLPATTIYIENEPEKDLEDFLEIYLPKEEKKE
jgi:hypothetical protein